MNLHATQAEKVPEPRSAGIRFTYTSGARPLDGYTIKRGIGRGGFGEVYYALSDAGKEVALKLIRRNLDVEVRGVTHCLNLKHPHLLGIHDIKEDEQGDSWVIMEFVAGESLEDVIARFPNGMPKDEIAAWMHGLVSGVAYLHDKGIVHRDLKPANIFSDEGLVKIGDYGLSKFISASRRSGQTESVGTVHYMAPEVANGRYGKEIDIYALGIILFEMLTGRVPFEGESVGEVLMKHLTAEPDLSALSEPYRSIVKRALDKDPDRRAKSVNELLVGLPGPGAGEVRLPVHTELAAPLAERVERARPNGPIDAAKVAAATAAAAAAAGAATMQANEEPIWRGIRDGLKQLSHAWNSSGMSKPTRFVLGAIIIIAILSTTEFWFPMLVLGGVAYGVYWVIRAIVIGVSPQPTAHNPGYPPAPPQRAQAMAAPFAASPHPVGTHFADAVVIPNPPPPVPQHHLHRQAQGRRRVREQAIPVLPLKSPRELFTELVGSMLLSVVAVLGMTTLFLVARGATPTVQDFAWLTIVGTAGTWAVLLPSTFWQGREGEAVYRRFVQLLLGLALGAVAWSADEFLLVDLHYADAQAMTPSGIASHPLVGSVGPHFNSTFYAANGSPLLMAYLPYFGGLFLLLRWWKQSNPLRSARLRLWPVVVTTACAGLLSMAWPFPQPWGMGAAATISVAVQLSSPWVDFRRSRLERAA